MDDFRDRYERQHFNAVRAGAVGRNGSVRQPVSYLKFTEVDPALKKRVKKSMSEDKKKKPKAKSKTIAKPKKPLSSGASNEPPKKSALQKKLLEIGWKKYEEHMDNRWR